MKNNFFYQKPLANIYARPSKKSEVTSQILFGEKFKILIKKKNWVKIKTDYDNYSGFIKNEKFSEKFNPTHKVYKLKTIVFKKINNKFIPSRNFLYFASKISLMNLGEKFIEFKKNNWVKKKDLKQINYNEKNISKILKLFLNTKYLWGGKTSNGIDCSALIQIYFYFNNIFFPRDTKDQVKFLKKNKNLRLYKKDNLMYWKGHVSFVLNKNLLIHAYGPKKKVVIMKIKKTIREIKKNTNLDLKLI
ncbi:C40 family peptidase [Candidatus Pelagibacter sp.]|nr:C40 family peptidase [Candidatus Pelagibacter sp.]